MNERVWLQFESPFVNMLKAIFPAIASSILVCACSGPSGTEENVKTTPPATPQISVIWETEEADYPIIDIAMGRTNPDNLFISAVLGDNRVQTFDLDGALVASSSGAIAGGLTEGAPLTVSDEQFAAHLGAEGNGGVVAALVSPKLQIVASAPVEGATTMLGACKGASTTDLGAAALISTNGIELGNVERLDDAVFFNSTHSILLSDEIRDCILVDSQSGFAATTGGMFSFSSESGVKKISPEAPRDLAVATTDAGSALLWLGQQDGLVRVHFMDDLSAPPYEFKLQDGLTVTAPTQMTSIATISGHVSVDYPSGLFAATGFYDDASPRIAYASLETILQAASAARRD